MNIDGRSVLTGLAIERGGAMNVLLSALSEIGRRCRVPVAVTLTVALALGPMSFARAGEPVEWSGFTFVKSGPHAVLDNRADAQLGDLLLAHNGLAFSRKGGLFRDTALQHTVIFAAGKADSGIRLFTTPRGDQLFVHYRATDAEPPHMAGQWEFLGGSGRYEGITGSGTYTATEAWDRGVILDLFTGDYRLRGYAADQLGPFADDLTEDEFSVLPGRRPPE